MERQHLVFFDCPNHRDCLKWNSHPAPKFHTCQKGLEDKDCSAPAATSVVANVTLGSTDSSNITSLLASSLSLATGNEVVIAYITDALNAIHNL